MDSEIVTERAAEDVCERDSELERAAVPDALTLPLFGEGLERLRDSFC